MTNDIKYLLFVLSFEQYAFAVGVCHNYWDTANILRLSISFGAIHMFRRVCRTKTVTSWLDDFDLLRLGWLNTLLSSCRSNCYWTTVWSEVNFSTINTALYVLIYNLYAMFTIENSHGLSVVKHRFPKRKYITLLASYLITLIYKSLPEIFYLNF